MDRVQEAGGQQAGGDTGEVTPNRRTVVLGASATILAGAAPRRARGMTEADVIVVGAGLAGLNAATRLEAAGLNVTVLEAEARVGGRLYTLDDLPGRPEAGAIQIGKGYHRLEAIAAAHGIALVPGGAEARDVAYRVNGVTVAGKDWAGSAANRLTGEEHGVAPALLAPRYWSKLPVLATPDAWLTADMAALDIPYDRALMAAGASAEAVRLIDANLNGNAVGSLSLLHVLRALAVFRAGAGPTRLIAGGAQRLPEAMASALKSDVRLSSRVRAMGTDGHGAWVRLSNGKLLQARAVICTIPFAAMRTMPIEGDVPPALIQARRALPYTHATFAYLLASEPFWRHDGLPETLWTDETLLGRVFVLSDDPPMLKLFITGTRADAVDRMTDEVAGARMIAALEAARPSARGKLRPLRRFSWQRQAGARGIYHHIGAGLGQTMADAVQSESPRLVFAGEHMTRGGSGIEGALESGERAANAILGRV